MNNIIAKIKSGLLNRNTVTILGVLAGVIILWLIYSSTLNKAVNPIKVPVANKELTAGTIITKDDIDYVEINSDVLKKASVITKSSQLIGYYINNDTSVTEGAMFYDSQVVTKDELTTRDIEKAPEGYKIYWMDVDLSTTYANSIYPGDKIDLWLKTDMDSMYIYEEFITSIEVIAVRDASGYDVFGDATTSRTPAVLVFAVKDEMYDYLSYINYLSNTKLYPVPRNKAYTDAAAEPEIVNDLLIQYIDSQVLQLNSTNTTNTNQNSSETE